MASNGYLKIDDIKGESQRTDHEEEIIIASFSFGASRSTFRNSGGQREPGLPDLQAVSISKDYDASSPYLALACLNGKNLGEVVLTLRKDQGDAHSDFLTVTMSNTMVESYSTSGAVGANPMDTFSLSFDKIKVKYLQDTDDLTAGNEHEVEYDVLKAAT